MAIRVGLGLKDYWEISPKQFEKYIDVYIEKEKERLKEEDFISFNLGKYIAYGVNEPKKYPNKPFLEDKIKLKAEEVNETKVMSIEEMKEVMRKNTLILGGTIKKNGKTNSRRT